MIATFLSSKPIPTPPWRLLVCACPFSENRYSTFPGHALRQLSPAVPDHRDVPRLHTRLERDDVAVLPQIHGDGVTRKDRRREPRRVTPERGRIVIGKGLQHTAA